MKNYSNKINSMIVFEKNKAITVCIAMVFYCAFIIVYIKDKLLLSNLILFL